tara:strand:+ start:3053 stop:4051 length:999 start_codon:yes stop_codon:yes gene_type:complete
MSKSEELKMQPFDPSQGRKDRRVSMIQVARAVGKRIRAGKPNTKFNYQEILKFAWVPVELCYFNYGRQRYPEPKQVNKLHNKWNIICVTPLQARYSAKDNRYYIADGQQHGIDWTLQYGEGSMVPVFYVVSEDENIESIQLLALNTDSEPMAKYFIHQQEVIMGVKAAVDLDNCVINAGCFTGYKKRVAGVITHITDLWLARDHYGLEPLGQVLTKMRQYWPTEKIATATMLGFLKVREVMENEGVFSDELFEDVIYQASEFFESSDRLHNDIKEQFEVDYPTNYRGMGVREKVASGIIDAYEQLTGKALCAKPFTITMPSMEVENEEELVY